MRGKGGRAMGDFCSRSHRRRLRALPPLPPLPRRSLGGPFEDSAPPLPSSPSHPSNKTVLRGSIGPNGFP